LTLADIEQALDVTCDTVIRNEQYFSDLDGLAGDGDFGTSLATGFRVIKAECPRSTRAHRRHAAEDLDDLLQACRRQLGPDLGHRLHEGGMADPGQDRIPPAT
jgi:phosphoenolpyruvate---glycerone phosphotransferase subunit DhaL